MGTPVLPAPYCDSYLTQISKSKQLKYFSINYKITKVLNEKT